jgi:hypothetical protein
MRSGSVSSTRNPLGSTFSAYSLPRFENGIYKLLRTEMNAKVQCRDITIDDNQICEVPKLGCVKTHGPPEICTAMLMLQHISTLSAGLSARHLQGLLK